MKLPRHLCRPLGPTLDLVEHGPPWTVREEMPAPPPKCDVQRHCRNHGPKCCSACPWCLLQVTAAQHSFRSPGGTWDAGVKWGKAGPQLEGGQRGPWAQQGPAGREGAHELPDRRQSTSTSTSTSTTTTTQSRESGIGRFCQPRESGPREPRAMQQLFHIGALPDPSLGETSPPGKWNNPALMEKHLGDLQSQPLSSDPH